MMQPNTTMYAYSQHISSSSDLNDLLQFVKLHLCDLMMKNISSLSNDGTMVNFNMSVNSAIYCNQ